MIPQGTVSVFRAALPTQGAFSSHRRASASTTPVPVAARLEHHPGTLDTYQVGLCLLRKSLSFSLVCNHTLTEPGIPMQTSGGPLSTDRVTLNATGDPADGSRASSSSPPVPVACPYLAVMMALRGPSYSLWPKVHGPENKTGLSLPCLCCQDSGGLPASSGQTSLLLDFLNLPPNAPA